MDKKLKEYIDKNIKSKYKTFDKAHNISHYNFVTKNCRNYAKILNFQSNNSNNCDYINLDIAFIVGAYHDIGLINGREKHALFSGEFVRNDLFLKNYYNEDIIEMIAEAVEDHSSHLEYEPRNIYGKIVADADRNNSKYLVFSRPIKYGLKNQKHLSKKEQINRVYDFVQKKFGRNGYVKYWLDIEETKKEQQEIWNLLDDEILCKKYIEGVFDEITKGKYIQKI